jgi:CBS domain-containing protein
VDQAPIERIDSFPYCHRVRDLLRPLVDIAADSPLEQAARRMRDAGVGTVVVLDGGGRPAGILTERDLMTAVAEGGAAALAVSVGARMSRPVATVAADAFLYAAIGRLQRLGIRHLVAVEPNGRAVGVVSARALLRLRAGRALALGDEIGAAETPAALAAAHATLPALARGLRAEGVTAVQVATVIAAALRDITARAAALAEAELGPPPAPYALLVLGSGGRGESLLAADQDNALVLGGRMRPGSLRSARGSPISWMPPASPIARAASWPLARAGAARSRAGSARSTAGCSAPRAKRCSTSISSSVSRWPRATLGWPRRCAAMHCRAPAGRRCSCASWRRMWSAPAQCWGRSAAGARSRAGST